MALFKIYQGDSSRLPNEKHDGWVYVTLDKPAMYVDLVKRNADGSEVAGAALERIKLYDYIKSDIAEGKENKIAWYNTKGSITSSTSIITNGTNLGIGEEDITKVPTTFYVKGTSRFNGSVQFANGTTYYIDNSGKAVFNTLGVGNITSADITSTNIQPKTSQAYNLGSSTSRWKAVYIGTKDTYGSSTNPIYWNGGVPTACSYSLNASINSGTTNQLAWYNSSNSITTGTKLATNGTNLGIGTTAVGDIGSNALYVNGTSKFVGTTTHTDYIYRSYSASNQSPMIWMNGSDYDNYLWQISSGTTTKQYYGYGLKYIGAGNGVGNYLRLIADNQNNTDVTAIGINQNGQVGIGADANASYRLYVNGNSYFNGNTTHNGIDYFANGTTYYINNSADFILNNGKVSKLGINANVSDTYILNVNGSSYFGGNSYNQNIIPIVDNTYTLGESTSSSNKRWKAVYIGTANSYGANSDTSATPIYWNNGIPAPLSVTKGGIAQPVYLKNGSITACSDDKGSTTKPVYMKAGTITECSYTLSSTVNSGTANQLAWYNSSTSITTGTKLVTNGTNLGIGTTAINDVGSNALYVNGASKFNGNVTATKFIGPLQGNANTATALTSSAGSSTTPIYFSSGKPVACGNSLAVSITGNAATATAVKDRQTGTTTYLNYGASSLTSASWLAAWNGYELRTISPKAVQDLVQHSRQVTVDLSSLDNSKWFPVTGTTLPSFGYNKIKVSVQLNSGTVPSWSTHESGFTCNMELYVTANGWGTTGGETIVLASSYSFASIDPCGFQQQSYNSMPVLWLRGGGKYFVETDFDCTWIVRTSSYDTYNSGSYVQTVTPTTTYPGIDGINGTIKAGKVYGAVWNDYAEYRSTSIVNPGQCVVETGLGDLVQSTKRLQPGANIVSDTFGFAIGETEKTKTPLAVSGRVLAYPYEDRYSYSAGDPVCSGPNGTISKMTREEVREYPDRIVGTVSEIPEYETWGTGNVKVDGRIWIKIK